MKTETNGFSFVLRPSTIVEAGIGVFALHDIAEGTRMELFLKDFEEEVCDPKDVPEELRGYCLDQPNGKILCPKYFNSMDIGNYLNHSQDANVRYEKRKDTLPRATSAKAKKSSPTTASSANRETPGRSITDNRYAYHMIDMRKLPKIKKGDKVAILSPSFAAPGKWPHVYEFGLTRVREVFGLEPVEFPTTKKIGASGEERVKDLIDAFTNPEIKAVITSLGGNDQVTYIKNLPAEPFILNPKLFFGYSDSSHFCNFLFQSGVPSYYGASLFTQFAMQGEMDAYTVEYITHALFDEGEFEIRSSETYNDVGLGWDDPALLEPHRTHWPNEGWYWDGVQNAEGLLWGGCIESVDEMLRHGVQIPTLEQFADIVLMLESSEEIPPAEYVFRVLRALGERGILKQAKGVLVGRPKAWEFDKQRSDMRRKAHRAEQREIVLKTVRTYNLDIPIVQNLDFGHTDPQIPMPYGGKVRMDSEAKKIFAHF